MIPIGEMQTRYPNESVSIRYANEQTDYVAGQMFPETVQAKSVFRTWQYDTSQFRRRLTRKANAAEADLVDYGGFYTNRTSEAHKLAGEWDPQAEADNDAELADIEQDVSMTIMDGLLIDRENEAATLATTSGNYPADLTSALTGGTDTWVDAGGDPRDNAKTARLAVRARCGKTPNALVLSYQGLQALSYSPNLIDFLKYTSGASIPVDVLKNLLEVQDIFVAKAQQNTNMEGNATQTLTEIWNDSGLFFVHDPAPRRRSVCYGRGYYRNRLYTYRYQDEKRGSGDGRIQRLEQGWNYIQAAAAVVSSSDGDFAAGYLLRNVF